MNAGVGPSGTLFVVATPIGNLADLTSRAREILGSVSACYAEDTRRTGRLLQHVGSTVRLRSLHEHNEEARASEILARLSEGETVALVTDAGTPGVSDPGRRAVRAVQAAGYAVVPIPGPSAVATAISVSGMPGDRFRFAGFAPRKGGAREEWMEAVAGSPDTVVVFEAPGRVGSLFTALEDRGAGDREAVVCRELTKLHEEVRRGTISELATVYRDETVKGEVTIVMSGAPAPQAGFDANEVMAVVDEMRAAGDDGRTIVQALRERFGLSRNEAYRLSLANAGEPRDG